MSYLDRHDTRDEPFAKILFYSVLIHYGFLFLFFGNPFLILSFDDEPSNSIQSIDISLLSLPIIEEEEARIPFPKMHGKPNGAGANLSPLPAFPEGPVDRFEIGHEISESEKNEKNPPLSTDEVPDLIEAEASSPADSPKEIVRLLPPNMTGPEDCLLKVVGMVCPTGDFECVSAYKEFCASLPE